MRNDCSNIYILSFTAGADAGLAIVTAYSELEALQVLKNQGMTAVDSIQKLRIFRNKVLFFCK